MSLARFPFPSIHHVLEENLHDTFPGRPSVITVLECGQPDWSPPTSTPTFPIAGIGYIPSMSHLMKTIDLRDAEPIAKDDEEQFSFIVHFPDEVDLDNDADADVDVRTIFKEKRPSTSRGFRHEPERGQVSSNAQDSAKRDHSPSITNAVRKLLPLKLAEALLRRTNRQ